MSFRIFNLWGGWGRPLPQGLPQGIGPPHAGGPGQRTGAKTAGLKEVLIQALTIAEAQIDTNPASRQVRALEAMKLRLMEEAKQCDDAKSKLAGEVEEGNASGKSDKPADSPLR